MLNYCTQKATEMQYKRGRSRVYCVVLDRKGKIVSESSNSYVKTHPTQKSFATMVGLPNKEFLHAEIASIIKAKMKGHKLVVARVDSKGKPVNSKPCPVCELAIRELTDIVEVEWS